MSTNHGIRNAIHAEASQSGYIQDLSMPSTPQGQYQNGDRELDAADFEYQHFLLDHLPASVKNEFNADLLCPQEYSAEVGMTGAVESGLDLASHEQKMQRLSSDASSYAYTDSSLEHAASSNSPESFGTLDGGSPMSYSLSTGTYHMGLAANSEDGEHFSLAELQTNPGLNLTNRPPSYSAMSEPVLSQNPQNFYTHHYHHPFQHLHAEIYASPENPVSPASSEPIHPSERAYAPAQRRAASAKCSSSRFKATEKVTKPGRKTKLFTTNKDRSKLPILDKPLSELTKDYPDDPIEKIRAQINRSTEQRKAEVQSSKDGRIKRPMNAFILYRSAFTDRAKHWGTQNNHQIVSTICGLSWKLETPEIKQKFNELANLERRHHQDAHPGYKFTPTKVQGSKKKGGDDDTELSDIEEPQGWNAHVGGGGQGFGGILEPKKKTPASRGRKHSKITAELAMPSSKDFVVGLPLPASNGASKSSFEATNPGKTPPPSIADSGMTTGTYLQTTIETASATNGGGVIENVTIKRTQGPTRLSVALQTPPIDTAGHTFDQAVAAQMQYDVRCSEAAVAEQLMAFDYSPVSTVSSHHDLDMYLSNSPPRNGDRTFDGMLKMSGGIQGGFEYQPGVFPTQNFSIEGAGQDISCIRPVVQAQGPHHPHPWGMHPDATSASHAVQFETSVDGYTDWSMH